MKLIKSILVAYDFSEPSQIALKQGIDLAKRFGANLSVISILDHNTSNLFGLKIDETFISETTNRIAKDIDNAEPGFKSHNINIFEGDPYFFILAKAQTLGADLIVMGSHSRKGIHRLALGSVAEKIVKASPVPVLVSRTKTLNENGKVVCPINSEEWSEEVIPYAELFAAKLNSEVQLFHSVDPTVPIMVSEFDYSSFLKSKIEEQRERLEKVNTKYNIATPPLVQQGFVEDVLSTLCEEQKNIDLITISTEHEGDLKHIFLGGHSTKIVRSVPCSVLAIKPQAIRDELHRRIEQDVEKAGASFQ